MSQPSVHDMYSTLTMQGGGLGGSGGADDSLIVLLRDIRELYAGNVAAVENSHIRTYYNSY